MYQLASKAVSRLTWQSLAVLALLFGLGLSPTAYADSYTNRITLYAPDAPTTAWTAVQFQTPGGAWYTVDGWQGALDTLEDTGLRLKTWAVSPDNADQGPFRWVVYTVEGGDVWGMSDSFYLPGGDNVNLEATVQAATTTTDITGAAATPVELAVTPVAATVPSTDATDAPPVASDSSTWLFDCLDCDHSLISVYLPDAPAGSFAAVQYQMPDGTWHNVEAWAGDAAEDDNGLQQAHYSVYPENFGQGPFRWVVVQPDDTIWGIGAEFDLPSRGVHYFQFLLRH